MPNQIGPRLEQRIIAFSLGHLGCGPTRTSAELAREKWGAIRILAARRLTSAGPRWPEHQVWGLGVDRPNPLLVSWNSAKDMDAIAIHTEAHIRSGTQMAKQGLLGADGRPPLNPEMDAFFKRYRQEKFGGAISKCLAEVIEADKRFCRRSA